MTRAPRLAILKSHLGAGGGLEKYARRLAAGFAERGAEVQLLTSRYHDENLDGYQILNLAERHRLGWRRR